MQSQSDPQFGVGCMYYVTTGGVDIPTGLYWINDAAYDVGASLPNGQRACGCVQ